MKKLFATITALALTVSPLAATARTMTESEINTYINLIETVKKTGVSCLSRKSHQRFETIC